MPILTGLALGLVLLSQAVEAPETVAAEIPGYRRLSPGLAAAGQPSPEALARLAELGFVTVINLRTAAEPGVAEEAALVAEQQLRYVHVPISPDSFSSADVDAVAAVLDDPAAAPVLLHCASSNRVGGVIAVLASRRGADLETALAEGREAGLTSESLRAIVERLIEREAAAR